MRYPKARRRPYIRQVAHTSVWSLACRGRRTREQARGTSEIVSPSKSIEAVQSSVLIQRLSRLIGSCESIVCPSVTNEASSFREARGSQLVNDSTEVEEVRH